MDFSKRKNIIILIVSLVVVVSLTITATYSWLFSSVNNANLNVNVLKFDFKTNNVYSNQVTVDLSECIVGQPSNYTTGLFAPGIKGSHTFEFSNRGSDVPVRYTVTANIAESNIPENLEIYRDFSASSSDLAENCAWINNNLVSSNDNVLWEDLPISKGGTDRKTFGFYWRYKEDDESNKSDMEFFDNNDSLYIKFNIVAYQVLNDAYYLNNALRLDASAYLIDGFENGYEPLTASNGEQVFKRFDDNSSFPTQYYHNNDNDAMAEIGAMRWGEIHGLASAEGFGSTHAKFNKNADYNIPQGTQCMSFEYLTDYDNQRTISDKYHHWGALKYAGGINLSNFESFSYKFRICGASGVNTNGAVISFSFADSYIDEDQCSYNFDLKTVPLESWITLEFKRSEMLGFDSINWSSIKMITIRIYQNGTVWGTRHSILLIDDITGYGHNDGYCLIDSFESGHKKKNSSMSAPSIFDSTNNYIGKSSYPADVLDDLDGASATNASLAPNGGRRWVEIHNIVGNGNGSTNCNFWDDIGSNRTKEDFNWSLSGVNNLIPQGYYNGAAHGKRYLNLGADLYSNIDSVVWQHFAAIKYEKPMNLFGYDNFSFSFMLNNVPLENFEGAQLVFGFHSNKTNFSNNGISYSIALTDIVKDTTNHNDIINRWIDISFCTSNLTFENNSFSLSHVEMITIGVKTGTVKDWGTTFMMVDNIRAFNNGELPSIESFESFQKASSSKETDNRLINVKGWNSLTLNPIDYVEGISSLRMQSSNAVGSEAYVYFRKSFDLSSDVGVNTIELDVYLYNISNELYRSGYLKLNFFSSMAIVELSADKDPSKDKYTIQDSIYYKYPLSKLNLHQWNTITISTSDLTIVPAGNLSVFDSTHTPSLYNVNGEVGFKGKSGLGHIDGVTLSIDSDSMSSGGNLDISVDDLRTNNFSDDNVLWSYQAVTGYKTEYPFDLDRTYGLYSPGAKLVYINVYDGRLKFISGTNYETSSMHYRLPSTKDMSGKSKIRINMSLNTALLDPNSTLTFYLNNNRGSESNYSVTIPFNSGSSCNSNIGVNNPNYLDFDFSSLPDSVKKEIRSFELRYTPSDPTISADFNIYSIYFV